LCYDAAHKSKFDTINYIDTVDNCRRLASDYSINARQNQSRTLVSVADLTGRMCYSVWFTLARVSCTRSITH